MIRRAADLRSLRFLVVDDVEFSRKIVKTVLRALGVPSDNMREAESGTEALVLLVHYRPDIAIVDYMMPQLDGIRFARTLRQDPSHPCRMMPIVMLSAYSKARVVASARDAGVTEFVVKPISVSSLYEKLEEVILHPRQFVETPTFFGPDRHRHRDRDYGGPRRRSADMPALADPV